jgi:hypothetical protein
MEEPGSKKSEGSGRIMRDRNDKEERGDEEEERTTPVRRGPTTNVVALFFQSPFLDPPTNDLDPHSAHTTCIATTATAYPTTTRKQHDPGVGGNPQGNATMNKRGNTTPA